MLNEEADKEVKKEESSPEKFKGTYIEQNTILNDMWDESYSKDMAILESLLIQDDLDQ